MFYAYIIESITSGKWYYGFTNELEQRLEAHNKGLNKSTSGRGPWKYIFKRAFAPKVEAQEFENYLKKTRNKVYVRNHFAEHFI